MSSLLCMYTGPSIKKEASLLLQGKLSKPKKILKLLEAVWLPNKVAILHCKGHQKGDNSITQGNHLVDKTERPPVVTQAKLLPTV